MSVLCSPPVWAISVAAFCHNWVYYLAVTDLPAYFKNVLRMKISENGLTSGIPFVFAFFTQVLGSFVADYLLNRGYSVTKTRKFVTAIGFCPTAACLCLVGYVGCDDSWLSVTFIVLLVGLANLSYGGYGVNQLDLSPRFAGVLWSFTAFFANISGGITPLVTGFITNKNPSRSNYRIVFIIAAGVCMCGVLFYILFGSGEEEEWNREDMGDGRKYKGKEECKKLLTK